jgi:hypothetical protein
MWVRRARAMTVTVDVRLTQTFVPPQLGTAAAEVVARDAQQLQSVSTALDSVQSELQLARKVLLRGLRV